MFVLVVDLNFVTAGRPRRLTRSDRDNSFKIQKRIFNYRLKYHIYNDGVTLIAVNRCFIFQRRSHNLGMTFYTTSKSRSFTAFRTFSNFFFEGSDWWLNFLWSRSGQRFKTFVVAMIQFEITNDTRSEGGHLVLASSGPELLVLEFLVIF